MALVKRNRQLQPTLMNVEAPTQRNDQAAVRKRRAIASVAFWPQVTITPDALQRLETLTILHSEMPHAFQATVSSILESIRLGGLSGVGFEETAVIPSGDLPSDIRVFYQYSNQRLVIVDIRRPDQPSLFGGY